MRLKAFICDVLAREFYYWSALSPHTIDIELLSSENHEYPKEINRILQSKIDCLDKEKHKYDYILLGYGLCGKVLEGIESKDIPMIISRAHDCITFFMGSKEKYNEYFINNAGTMYYIESWIERNGLKKERKELEAIGLDGTYEEYEKKYGEEGAKYLIELANEWKNKYNKALYIASELTNQTFSNNYVNEVKKLACERNWSFDEIKENSSLIKKMVFGEWNDKEFHMVPSFSKIYQTVDERIVSSYDCDNLKVI